ncbi:MAG TPA: hypothetical protein PLC04_08670 [Candidatus Kapabacteria bacterium]|nr:hypothetical protein [Candidatus Kapabacteria bacterium]
MKQKTTIVSKLSIVLFIIALNVLVASAQNFTNNTGGTYTAACEAVVRIKSNGGQFNGSAPLGQTTANPIQGTVDWASTAPGQPVQALHYTNLYLSGGTKSIPDGVYVGGSGCTSPLPGYTALTGGVGYYAASGDRTYTGTFYYEGTSGQTIFAENGGSTGLNRYNNLDLSGSPKTAGGATTLDGLLAVHSTATLTTNYDFALGTGASTADGNITVTGGNFRTTGTGTFAMSTGSVFNVTGGTLSLNSTGHFTQNGTLSIGAAGAIALGAGSYLDVAGAFTNADAEHDNMTFDATSTVAYTGTSGTQNIVFTSDAAPANNYGILTFTGAATKSATGNIHTRGNVSVTGGIVDMGTNYATGYSFYTDATGGNKISYTSPNNDQYIQGKVVLRGTIGITTAYTLNNAQTQATFNTAPDGTSPYFAMFSVPGVQPDNSADFAQATDLTRNVRIDYSGSAGVISTLRVGYVESDKVNFTASEGNLRFEEAWGDNTGDRQKVSGGAGIATNNGATDPRFVQLVTNPSLGLKLDGAANGGTIYSLSQNSNIVLTSKPMLFIAVNSGRWTNPNTWDEGAYPSSTDNAELRTLVYAGIAGPAYGTPALNNTTTETSVYGSNAIANSITIPTGYANASLIVGNEDNGDGFVVKTALSGVSGGINAGVYNNNATANSGDWNNKATAPGVGTTVNGLFISSIKNAGYTVNPVIFGTAQITNAGTITNHQVIEIGQ